MEVAATTCCSTAPKVGPWPAGGGGSGHGGGNVLACTWVQLCMPLFTGSCQLCYPHTNSNTNPYYFTRNPPLLHPARRRTQCRRGCPPAGGVQSKWLQSNLAVKFRTLAVGELDVGVDARQPAGLGAQVAVGRGEERHHVLQQHRLQLRAVPAVPGSKARRGISP